VQAYDGADHPFAVDAHAERLVDLRTCCTRASVLDDDVGPLGWAASGSSREK
jgi:hypothetical protein